MSDAIRRLIDLAASDQELAGMPEGRKQRILLAIRDAAMQPADPGAPDDEGLLASHGQGRMGKELGKRLSRGDVDHAYRLLQQERERAVADRDAYWSRPGKLFDTAVALQGAGEEGWTLKGAAKGALGVLPFVDPINDDDRSRLQRGYGIGVRAAIKERVLEENPQIDPKKADEEVERRIQSGETGIGGIAGWLGEKLVPATVGFAKDIPTALAAQAAASALPGIGNAAAAAATSTRLGNVARLGARLALSGAVTGATRPLDPGVQAQLDEAGAGFFSAAQLAARGRQALDRGARMAIMGVGGDVLGAGLDKFVNVAGKAAFGGAAKGARWERNPDLSRWMGEHGKAVGALRTVRELAVNVASDVAETAVRDPAQLARHPGAVLADSIAFSLAPSAMFGRASREMSPKQIEEVRRAVAQNVFDVTIDDSLAAIEGLPLRHRMTLVAEYESKLRQETERAKEAFGRLDQAAAPDNERIGRSMAETYARNQEWQSRQAAESAAHGAAIDQERAAFRGRVENELGRAVAEGEQAARSAKSAAQGAAAPAVEALAEVDDAAPRNAYGFDLGIAGELEREPGESPPLPDGAVRIFDEAGGGDVEPSVAAVEGPPPFATQRLEQLRDTLVTMSRGASRRAETAKGDAEVDRWTTIAAKRAEQLAGVDEELALRRRDPARAAAAERFAEFAARGRNQGLVASKAREMAESAASAIEEGAKAPVELPPEAAIKPPDAVWTFEEVEALKHDLGELRVMRTALEALGDAATPRSRAAREKQIAEAEAAVSARLAAKDGRSIADMERTARSSSEWETNPAMVALRAAGWSLPAKSHEGYTFRLEDASLKGLEGKAGAVIEAIGGEARLERWLARIVLGDKQSKLRARVGRESELYDALYGHAQEALLQFAATYSGSPQKAAEEALRHVRQAVARTSSGFVAAQRAAEREKATERRMAAADLDRAVREAGSANVERRPEPGEAPRGGARATRDESPVNVVLNLATRQGGPLHDDPDAAAAVQLWLDRVKLGRPGRKFQAMRAEARKATGEGRAPAQQAEGAWTPRTVAAMRAGDRWAAMPEAQRKVSARAVEREFDSKIDALDEYLRGVDYAKEAGFEFLRTADGDTAAKIEYLSAGLPLRPLFDWLNGPGEGRSAPLYGIGWRAAKRPTGFIKATYEALLGTGRSLAGEAELNRVAAMNVRLDGWQRRMRSAASKLMPTWRAASSAAKVAAFDRTDGYRHVNDGVALEDGLADARWRSELAKLSPEDRAAAESMHTFFRTAYDEVRAEILTANPDQPMIGKGYATHVRVDELVEPKTLMESFRLSLDNALRIAARDADAARARRPTGAPGSERLMRRDDKAGGDIQKDLTKLLPQLFNSADFARRFALHHAFDQILRGVDAALVLPKGQPLDDFVSKWIATGRTQVDEGLQVETRSGNGRTLAMGVLGGDNKPRKISADTVELDVRALGGDARYTLRARVGQDGAVQFLRKAGTRWEPVKVTAKQGGMYQFASRSSHKDGSLAVDMKAVKLVEERAAMLTGKEAVGNFQRLIDGLMSWTSSRFLGDLNWPLAIKNVITQSVTAAWELGPGGLKDGMEFVASKEGRKLLRKVGLWTSDEVDPDAGLFKDLLAGSLGSGKESRSLLPADASRMDSIVAGYHDFDHRGRFMFNIGEEMMKGAVYGGALKRAERDIAKSGITRDEAAANLRNGVAKAELNAAVAHQRAIAAVAKTGAMIDIVSQPLAMKNPALRLLLQFQRPALAVMNHGLTLARQLAVEFRDSAKAAITTKSAKPFFNDRLGHALQPVARWVAGSVLLALADEGLGTNLFGGIGPRLVDVGDDALGVSLADAFPSLEDPDESLVMSRVQVPFASIGAGPAVGMMQRSLEAAAAWMRGDEDGMRTAFWNDSDFKKRTLESAMPYYQTLRRIVSVADPASPMVGPEIAPSGVEDKPYMVMGSNGRPVNMTTDDALMRQAVFGSIGSRTGIDEIRMGRRTERLLRNAATGFRSVRRQWYDAKVAYQVTGDASDLARVEELEQKARGMERELSISDFEREEMLQKTPAWVRQLGAGNTVAERATMLLKRWRALGPDGSNTMSKGELKFAMNHLIKDRSSLPDALADALLQAVRRAER